MEQYRTDPDAIARVHLRALKKSGGIATEPPSL
jgi:hypothetical protein